MPLVAALRWLVTTPTPGVGRAQLHAWPNTPHAIPTPWGIGGWARGACWLPHPSGAVAVPMPAPPDVLPCADGVGLRAVSASGTTTATVTADAVDVKHTPDRVGAHVRLSWSGGQWRTQAGRLPDAAARTGTLWPWARGVGVVWIDEDTVYRASWASNGRPTVTPLGPARPHDPLRVGPGGAVLVCTPGAPRGAAPGGPLQLLGVSVSADGPCRWSTDGDVVSVRDGADTCRLDLRTGDVIEREPDALPLTASDTLPIGGDGTTRWLAPRPHRAGDRLAGPDGRVWSLTDGACSEPVLGDGPLTATDDAWVTTRGRRVRWLGLDDLRPRGAVPLPAGSTVVALTPDGLDVIATLADGTAHRLSRGGTVTAAPPPDPARPSRGPVGEAAAALGLQHTALVGDRQWWWSDEGVLLSE